LIEPCTKYDFPSAPPSQRQGYNSARWRH
jgi:hypothetical protein